MQDLAVGDCVETWSGYTGYVTAIAKTRDGKPYVILDLPGGIATLFPLSDIQVRSRGSDQGDAILPARQKGTDNTLNEKIQATVTQHISEQKELFRAIRALDVLAIHYQVSSMPMGYLLAYCVEENDEKPFFPTGDCDE